MKFLHLADLHIGKRVNGFSMIDDQKYIIDEILKITDNRRPDAVIIAGDIYDKSAPSDEASELFDYFLTQISNRGVSVFIISGNHDSGVKTEFGSKIFSKSGIYVSGKLNFNTVPIKIKDGYGYVNVYILPFIKPADVKHIYSDFSGTTYNDAVNFAIGKMNVDFSRRNIIVSHQFVTGAKTCESEELSAGGLDNVDFTAYERFDYAALGHLHGPQRAGADYIRYSGTPLKYSFSEANHKKSVTYVEIKEKSRTDIELIPLTPVHDMKIVDGTLEQLLNMPKTDDYIKAVLCDDKVQMYTVERLRTVFPNIMTVQYKCNSDINYDNLYEYTSEKTDEYDMFERFFAEQCSKGLTDFQKEYIKNVIDEVRGK